MSASKKSDSNLFDVEAYKMAQGAVHQLKSAIAKLLSDHSEGLKATDIGRALGVNGDHLGDQTGWLQWTVLKMMELEGTVEQPKDRGPWKIKAI